MVQKLSHSSNFPLINVFVFTSVEEVFTMFLKLYKKGINFQMDITLYR